MHTMSYMPVNGKQKSEKKELTKRIPRLLVCSVLCEYKLSREFFREEYYTYNIGTGCPVYIAAKVKTIRKQIGERVEDESHKLITIARDTLRLYDPSTLFDTQALQDIRELCLAPRQLGGHTLYSLDLYVSLNETT